MVEPVVLVVVALAALLALAVLWKMIKFGIRVGLLVGVGFLIVWALRQAGVLPGGG